MNQIQMDLVYRYTQNVCRIYIYLYISVKSTTSNTENIVMVLYMQYEHSEMHRQMDGFILFTFYLQIVKYSSYGRRTYTDRKNNTHLYTRVIVRVSKSNILSQQNRRIRCQITCKKRILEEYLYIYQFFVKNILILEYRNIYFFYSSSRH